MPDLISKDQLPEGWVVDPRCSHIYIHLDTGAVCAPYWVDEANYIIECGGDFYANERGALKAMKAFNPEEVINTNELPYLLKHSRNSGWNSRYR